MPILHLIILSLILISASPANAEDRTAGRQVDGLNMKYKITTHDPYRDLKSQGYNTRGTFPHMWRDQDWETARWHKDWTPETAIQGFYDNRTFDKEFMRDDFPALSVGPTFYALSDHDQRRALKLLTDTRGIFAQGHNKIFLYDWKTNEAIGNYSKERGLILR